MKVGEGGSRTENEGGGGGRGRMQLLARRDHVTWEWLYKVHILNFVYV